MKLLFIFTMITLLTIVPIISAETCYDVIEDDCPSNMHLDCWEDNHAYYWDCKINNVDEANYNVKIDRSAWCEVDQVYDYDYDFCCSDATPYYHEGKCYENYNLQLKSDNYFTRHFECTPGLYKCDEEKYYVCSNKENEDSSDPVIREKYEWVSLGYKVGYCGYVECQNAETKCEGKNLYVCDFDHWTKIGYYPGECNVECISENDCKSDNLLDQYCEEGRMVNHYSIETCENNICVPDQKTVKLDKMAELCGIECLDNSDCAKNWTSKEYWKDKKLYHDIVEQKCQNELCTDIRHPVELNETFTSQYVDNSEKSKFRIFWEDIFDWIKSLF